jgi:hypothetical protein
VNFRSWNCVLAVQAEPGAPYYSPRDSKVEFKLRGRMASCGLLVTGPFHFAGDVGQDGTCGRLVTGPFRVAAGVRRLTTVEQLAKLPHKYRHTTLAFRARSIPREGPACSRFFRT